MVEATVEPGEPGSFLGGVRVVEVADELGEYCGKLLAGLGADVIKVEPLGGERTRRIGPFVDDESNPNRSLHFWHYNFGKRSVVLDLDVPGGRDRFARLVETADVVLDTRPKGYLAERGLGYEEELRRLHPSLVYARISPFGDDGPWAGHLGSDLIHLALGGVVMNCGYDPDPTGTYDTPPIAPQMWQSYHITGETMAMQIIAALNYRLEAGVGQLLSSAVHEAVSKNTETDLPDWVYSRLPHRRLTCRHSFGQREVGVTDTTKPGICRTKDGRWLYPYRTYLPGFGNSVSALAKVLAAYGMDGDLNDDKYNDPEVMKRPETVWHIDGMLERLVGSFTYEKDLWLDGQAAGLAWAPVRRPEENVADEHWAARGTFIDVEHPELGKTYTEVGARWYSPGLPWRNGPRAPLLDEHTAEVLADLDAIDASATAGADNRKSSHHSAPAPVLSKRGKPFALPGVRVVDLTWFLASAGAGRFFTAHGAEVIKVEHLSRLDGMRGGLGAVPDGGREERDRAEGPITPSPTTSVNRSGSFMEINAGKRGISLNLKDPRAIDILRKLIADADMVIEGFSPGTMDRMGLGYEELQKINPGIIYVQQSGMGQYGRYERLRTFGPPAQAMSGISEMSGLPEPYAPAGIGYSYLDWFGAYQMATAMMAALHRKRTTGRGCWIDSSQVDCGLYLTGTAVLDHSVNGRSWSRYGNRSPYLPAAPHGVYPAAGEDRWIAVAAFDQQQWLALTRVLRAPEWTNDPKLSTLDDRLANQDELDGLVAAATAKWEPFQLMEELQAAGVPAGVCQTAQDRYERDPQLAHLEWLVELDQAEIGRWPVKEIPVQFSETPTFVGGRLERSGPSYGQDNDYVYGELLGMSPDEIAALAKEGVI